MCFLWFKQNKAKALKVICAKLYEIERRRIQSSRSKLRSEQVIRKRLMYDVYGYCVFKENTKGSEFGLLKADW